MATPTERLNMNSPILPIKNPPIEHVRLRCYGCYRPKYACFCHTIPKINNQTNLLINSARIVAQALQNSKLIVGRNMELAGQDLGISKNAGLLYPRKNAKSLEDLPASELPDQFVFLDGTWNHARTMYRNHPADT